MARAPRLLVATAALLLGAMFVAPLWSIRLIAPQYPEGLGLLIRLSTISGWKENDLNSINSLNHYIGMRPIVASAIPELRFMPWIVGALMVGGLLVAAVGRRRLLVGWLVAFAFIGVAGMYDFWRWGYDYGHNLDTEDAIITVPGMTYQPPLIGSKQLLNFHATSLPHVGALAAGVAFLLGGAALVLSARARTKSSSSAVVLLAAAMSCGAVSHEIAFGADVCAECRMMISDRRFGAQIISTTGKAISFDSIDCLRRYLERQGAPGEIWLVDANHPGTLIAESNAQYRTDAAQRPPMGAVYAIAR